MSEIKIAGIVKESIVDGIGIRLSVFTQGCPHNCPECHNPHTHKFEDGLFISDNDILDMVKANPILSGITLTGGEPFCQAEKLLFLSSEVKKLGLSIWAFSGFTYEQLMSNPYKGCVQLLELVDVLVDSRFEVEYKDLTLLYRGSSNQRVIDCAKTREQNSIVLLEE